MYRPPPCSSVRGPRSVHSSYLPTRAALQDQHPVQSLRGCQGCATSRHRVGSLVPVGGRTWWLPRSVCWVEATRRLCRLVSHTMSGLLDDLQKHVSETSHVELTGVVKIIYMYSPNCVDWRKLTVAARPPLERCHGSHGARHAGQPAVSAQLWWNA